MISNSRSSAIVIGITVLLLCLTVWGNFQIPIPGTDLLLAPNEIPVSLGAAFSGPLGVLVLSLVMGIIDPSKLYYLVGPSHFISLMFIAYTYKWLFSFQKPLFFRFLGWIGIVFVYYCVFLVPIMSLILGFVYGQNIIDTLVSFYIGVIPEMIGTMIFTTLTMIALPKSLHKPLW